MSAVDIHAIYLDNFIRHLEYAKIKPSNVAFILKEPEWFQEKSRQQKSLCDVIVGFEDNTASAIEIKGSLKKRDKALSQIQHGRDFIKQYTKCKYRSGIFAVYLNPDEYHFEIYNCAGKKLKAYNSRGKK